MKEPLNEAEILAFLKAIEEGSITLSQVDHPQDIYAGNVRYLASNGWKLTIFNDANEWDYVDEIETPDGRRMDYDMIFNTMPLVDAYTVSDDVAWARYGIPGHCNFRCVKCGQDLPYEKRKMPYLCERCRRAEEVQG